MKLPEGFDLTLVVTVRDYTAAEAIVRDCASAAWHALPYSQMPQSAIVKEAILQRYGLTEEKK